MSGSDDIAQKHKLIETIRETLKADNELREKYQIGDKFRFVRDRLTKLLEQLENSLPISDRENSRGGVLSEEDTLVYVYLYNAQGVQFKTWQNLMNPKVFYEYSVNRPVYEKKDYIESLLRSKTNKVQHAYLTIAVNKDKILASTSETKDAVGNPVIKVKEGSLRYENVVSFSHNGQDYVLNEDGMLVKKE